MRAWIIAAALALAGCQAKAPPAEPQGDAPAPRAVINDIADR